LEGKGERTSLEEKLSPKEYREDRTLARGLKAGNRQAWSQFYGRYAASLFRFLVRRMDGHADVAADIAQDVIVVAMERIGTYDPRRGSLWAWLCGIAVNKSRESRRSRSRDYNLQERIKSQPAVEHCQPDLEAADGLDALVALNPRYQEVLRLKYVDGYTVREIAERLGQREKAIESRLTRARDAFRKAHEEPEPQPTGGTAE
jgi:RNA polymerase sigma-70 factor, ECF subfamily